MKTDLLSLYGVSVLSTSQAKGISAINKQVEDFKKEADKTIALYSLSVASDIATMLIKKLDWSVSFYLREYLEERLPQWIDDSIVFNDEGQVDLCSSTIRILESDLEQFEISYDEFISYFSQVWDKYVSIQTCNCIEISSAPGVSFTFELKKLD